MRALVLMGSFVLLPAMAAAQQPCTSDARQVAERIYQNVLERQADASGAASIVERLSNGSASVRDLVVEVAKSPEHRQRFLSGSNAQSVDYLYRHLLGRSPDASGMRSYNSLIGSRGVDAAIDSIVQSAEYQRTFGTTGVPGANRLFYCPRGGASAGGATDAKNLRTRFRGMDANSDGSISRDEWRGSRASFTVHDWDGNGVLSGNEIEVGGRRSAREDQDFDPATPGRFNSWDERSFRTIDRNRDGRISSNEWYYDTESFRRADRNRDNALTLAEFTDTVMDDDRDDQFTNLDLNGNGRIERREWHGSADAFDWLDRNNDNMVTRAEMVGGTPATDQFAVLDENRDGRLSLSEWRWSRRSFNQQDANGDGILSRREFRTGGAVPTTGR